MRLASPTTIPRPLHNLQSCLADGRLLAQSVLAEKRLNATLDRVRQVRHRQHLQASYVSIAGTLAGLVR
jgi:hypothetical protein